MRISARGILLTLTVLAGCGLAACASSRADELGTHGFVDSSGVRLHYVTAGKGPLVVMIHGFPDYWYTWRRQMPELSQHFQVVAYDQRKNTLRHFNVLPWKAC